MFVSVVILTVFSLIGLIKHFNSKLFWGFFGCLAGIFIMLSASILYTIKLSSYPYFNTLDHYFYYIL